MRLKDVNMIRLLPEFMRPDGANVGLAGGVDTVISDATAIAELLPVWTVIDRLDKARLDELAWELGIDWYDSTMDIETKRAIIKISDKTHQKLGTKWAAETILSQYFGKTEVREWWLYAGTPQHFKILSTEADITNMCFAKFRSLLEKIKRKSAWLDAILITLTGEMSLYAGAANHDTAIETVTMGDVAAILEEVNP